ncbi:MAG: DUF2459 domain-containing protein [Alphaproteobacteria bacterium]|nr:DUF2459 domain-containing protein [Alphaproteobacteria bacterium]
MPGSWRRRDVAIGLAVAVAAGPLASCAWTPVEPYKGSDARDAAVDVADLGWHTEIGLRAEAMTGALASLRRDFPDARYFTFGWGARDYYMAADPGFGDALRATVPGPAVMLVRALPRSPSETFGAEAVYAVPVASGGVERLCQFLWDYLEKDEQGRPRRAGPGPDAQSRFYAAEGTYDAGNTCNTWTATALDVAGVPVSASGVVFAGQVVDQVRAIALPAAKPNS